MAPLTPSGTHPHGFPCEKGNLAREPGREQESQPCLVTCRTSPCYPCDPQEFMVESALFLQRGDCKHYPTWCTERVQSPGGAAGKAEWMNPRRYPHVPAVGRDRSRGSCLPANLSGGPHCSSGLSLLVWSMGSATYVKMVRRMVSHPQ